MDRGWVSDPTDKPIENPHQFKPGQSGNPSGRPRKLEKRVRELLGDRIDTMTLAMADIVEGVVPKEGPLKDMRITTRDRIEAFKVLCDRGWGKPKQKVDVSGDISFERPVPMDELTDEQLEALAQLDGGVAGGDGRVH